MQVISAGLQHGGAGSGLYSSFAHTVDLDGEKALLMQRFIPLKTTGGFYRSRMLINLSVCILVISVKLLYKTSVLHMMS